jgi:predicted acyltransferase
MTHALKQREPDAKIGIPAIGPRVTSVDVLRGVVMFLMLFVNDVAGVKDAPAWMKHFHGNDGMTFVDLVFPAFLFIVGMSIPLAVRARVARGEGAIKLTLHALVRVALLLVLGLFMVNMGQRDHATWRAGLFPTLAYAAAIVACVRWPRMNGGLRIVGAAGLAALAWAYHPARGGWEHSWWGILGLIGWAYLVGFVVYRVAGDRPSALTGAAALLYALFIADRGGLFDGWALADWIDIGGALGTHAAITTGGILLIVAVQQPGTTTRERLVTTLLLAGAFALAAILLRRPWGINKNIATPAWGLWASAATCWLWAIFHVLNDVRGWTRGWGFMRDLGRNALLAYLIAPLFASLLQLTGIDAYGHLGNHVVLGIIRSLALATVIMVIAAMLYRRGVRTQI